MDASRTAEYGDELMHEQPDRLGWRGVADPDPQQHHHVAHATGHRQRRRRPLVGSPRVGELPLLTAPTRSLPGHRPVSPAVQAVWPDRAQDQTPGLLIPWLAHQGRHA